MNLKQEIEIMSEILEWCRMYAINKLPEAWDWYAVFCTAWNRLGKSRLEGVEGYWKLTEDIRQTQEFLREFKEEEGV
jgi:hypothetical protein